MNVLNPNVLFEYIFRDRHNYKDFGSVVFTNPDGLDLLEITEVCKLCFIDEAFFYPEKLGLPKLPLSRTDEDMWHEFEGVQFCTDPATNPLSIKEFLKVIQENQKIPV